MYAEFIRRRFPQNDRLGLYVAPGLPAVKLGKILMKERKVRQPGDVSAMYLNEGVFSSSYILLTDEGCFYDGQNFLWEDCRGAKAEGKQVVVQLNVHGSFTERTMKTGEDEAARIIASVIDNIAHHDPEKDKPQAEADYSAFSGTDLDWLRLRDEVMKTIDMLYDKFNDGKLSLIEYEEKKEDLLKRL